MYGPTMYHRYYTRNVRRRRFFSRFGTFNVWFVCAVWNIKQLKLVEFSDFERDATYCCTSMVFVYTYIHTWYPCSRKSTTFPQAQRCVHLFTSWWERGLAPKYERITEHTVNKTHLHLIFIRRIFFPKIFSWLRESAQCCPPLGSLFLRDKRFISSGLRRILIGVRILQVALFFEVENNNIWRRYRAQKANLWRDLLWYQVPGII